MGTESYGQKARLPRALAAGAAILTISGCGLLPPSLPEREQPQKVVWLQQNWTNDARFWFHHASQGTATIPVPYEWFIALEQPEIRLFSEPKLLADPAYLYRIGFIPSPKGKTYSDAQSPAAFGYGSGGSVTVAYDKGLYDGNPGGLPVGFALTKPAAGGNGGASGTMLGLTCAGCHTGHLTYKGTSVRIDGGPAMTDLGKFRTVLGLSIAYTVYVPGRFDRFADRVLGPDAGNKTRRDQLKKALTDGFSAGKQAQDATASLTEGRVAEGFGRLDALNRIGNQVFYSDLVGTKEFDPKVNLAKLNAPVNYPHTWTTSWFDWVQYDGSIRQPMVRNTGEAMGVAAQVNLTDPTKPLYSASIPVRNLFDMEELLAGSTAPQAAPKGFKGLAAPTWPEDILGQIDLQKVQRGKALYSQTCAGCHGPATNEPQFWNPTLWTTPDSKGLQFYKVGIIPLTKVGTDPAQAEVLATRTVKVPASLQIPEPRPDGSQYCGGKPNTVATDTDFSWALAAVVEKVIFKWYDDNNIPPEQRTVFDGYRKNCVQAPKGYKARPLNGIWATAPFLHNGSVPTLHDLFKPAQERPSKFCVGSLEFDPVKVGYQTACATGTDEFDTSLPGNLNIGHSFEGDGSKTGAGILGPAFTEGDRQALIEYLKTL
jgi:mono/diheme cytochrome c family protein